MKKFICGAITGAVIATAVGVGAVGVWDTIPVLKNDIKVIVNGNEVADDNFLYNDTTYIPLRAVSSALGEKVEYDEAENTAYIGERKDNMTATNKYIPPQENAAIWAFIKEKDGQYFILPDYINEIKGNAYAKENTNIGALIDDSSKIDLVVCGKTWTLTVIDGGRYIPYDIFVDEILPLLK